tara:strand:- start:942 stop:1421 length:480 start_codon:yes stop_codon:yes gene_type:complete
MSNKRVYNHRSNPQFIKFQSEEAKKTYVTIPPSQVSFYAEDFSEAIFYRKMIAINGTLKGLQIHLESLEGNLKNITVRISLARGGVSTYADVPVEQGTNEYPDTVFEVQRGDRFSLSILATDADNLKFIDERAGGLWGGLALYSSRSDIEVHQKVNENG